MVTIDEIRAANLRLLIARCGGQKPLADAIDKQPAQISQWVTRAPNSKTGKPRVLGSESARLIEEKMGLPLGWMDRTNAVGEATATYLRPDQLAILGLWEALDAEGRKTLHTVGNALAKQDLEDAQDN